MFLRYVTEHNPGDKYKNYICPNRERSNKNSVINNVSQLQASGETRSKLIDYFTHNDINVSMKVKQSQAKQAKATSQSQQVKELSWDNGVAIWTFFTGDRYTVLLLLMVTMLLMQMATVLLMATMLLVATMATTSLA